MPSNRDMEEMMRMRMQQDRMQAEENRRRMTPRTYGANGSYTSGSLEGSYGTNFQNIPFPQMMNWTIIEPDGTIDSTLDSTPPKKSSFKSGFKAGMAIGDFLDQEISQEKDKDRLKWLKTFKNCVLPQSVKNIIEEALTTVLMAYKFDLWGINEAFEKGLTNSILIYGPPGTGKTMIAESFAAVLNKNLLKITSAAIQSQIPGQAGRNITKNFETAKEQNAVLMFDECDSLLYDRNAVGMIMASEINHLLTEIERFDGVVILTTNRLSRLDPALQRRIIAKIELGLPEKPERIQIWRNLMPKKMPVFPDIDHEKLADAALSGGEIKNAILLAARAAIAKNWESVAMEHFETAIKSILKSKADFESVRPQVAPHVNLTVDHNINLVNGEGGYEKTKMENLQ